MGDDKWHTHGCGCGDSYSKSSCRHHSTTYSHSYLLTCLITHKHPEYSSKTKEFLNYLLSIIWTTCFHQNMAENLKCVYLNNMHRLYFKESVHLYHKKYIFSLTFKWYLAMQIVFVLSGQAFASWDINKSAWQRSLWFFQSNCFLEDTLVFLSYVIFFILWAA